MNFRGLFVTVCVAAIGAVSATHSGSARAEGVSSLPGDAGAWESRIAPHAVSVTLPSSRWKPSRQAVDLADFWTTSPRLEMLCGVTGVDAMPAAEFKANIPKLREYVAKSPRVVGTPTVEQGTTASGDSYVIVFYKEKLPPGITPGAMSRVWLRRSSLTTSLRFEAHLKDGDEASRRAFTDAVRVITKSVKTTAGAERRPASN